MEEKKSRLRILCSKRSLLSPSSEGGVRWLVGSPLFLPDLTVVSSLRCLHYHSDDPFAPDFQKEADDIRPLLLRGFDIVGALFIGNGSWEESAIKAIEASCEMSKFLFDDNRSYIMIGSAADLNTGDIHFVSGVAKSKTDVINNIVYEHTPEEYLWENGCLLRCDLAFRLPVYIPKDKQSDSEEIFSLLAAAAAAKLRDPHVVYLVEGPNVNSEEASRSVVLHGVELDFNTCPSDQSSLKDSINQLNEKALVCSSFFSENKHTLSSAARESADAIQVTVLFNQSRSISEFGAPLAQYLPASESARLLSFSFKLDVLCYASKDLPVTTAVSKLVTPGLVDQIMSMKKAIIPKLSMQHPQLCPFHFIPPGFLHPVTAIYDLRYGETEVAQGEFRKSLHARLGLPMDRPLLRIANALTFGIKGSTHSNIRSSSLLKDVHTDIPSSGVSGGTISLIDGSYEYYHYLHDGIDDNGWGCAYRSLQTIISWFRLQQYSASKVPSHREIQQALVEIGDKEPAFIGSREWIGAIELSFVLDKLLGVSCKIMNVRSGAELPEKCRELAMHFETQGTPVMIGGGVLAYTLLGVDYNEVSGDCAFLILDPHYTGGDDLKKIVNGGWCGWKKSVDSKGRNFFLKDKFYNLLLPQRPNMV
ncbi:putative Ufm1-specific protease isoform X1 [Iris pallida]|uniref:Probable Ufm1-specific protease n=1 Tax=Iris pallida TaxID=29817 RepID=A0AAX6G834_IRIPA|nr:putative Ufm1-specific protease isoform X1 [Iris pallida]